MRMILLYHRIGTKEGMDLELFEKHLTYIKTKKNLLLSFDDGTYDFYHYVFPLLQKHNIKALLAVCPYYVLDKTTLLPTYRLNFSEKFLFSKKSKQKGHFCTFQELQIMLYSGLVKIANHTYSHKNLCQEKDLEKELSYAKKILEKKLSQPIDTLVFPYGKFNRNTLKTTKEYSYLLRIGSGLNIFPSQLLYRICCDKIQNIESVFSPTHLFKYFFCTLKNRLRKR